MQAQRKGRSKGPRLVLVAKDLNALKWRLKRHIKFCTIHRSTSTFCIVCNSSPSKLCEPKLLTCRFSTSRRFPSPPASGMNIAPPARAATTILGTDQPLAHPVQCLQVELIGGLRSDEPHRRTLHCLGDRFCIAEVVLLSLAVGTDLFRRHQPSIVTKRLKFATEMIRADAGFHANQARWYIGDPRLRVAV